ncbi:MAG: hypothetical protein NTY36_04155 [Deltaproteobacteria bacterium]|nr:hypothetical protein [Deltaproteobacteria bacterium]
MKKLNFTKGLFVIAVILYLLLFTIESPRCESQPSGLNNAQSLVKSNDTEMAKSSDQEMQDDKSERFKVMEWVIRQNLMKQYERMEVVENLEDNLD